MTRLLHFKPYKSHSDRQGPSVWPPLVKKVNNFKNVEAMTEKTWPVHINNDVHIMLIKTWKFLFSKIKKKRKFGHDVAHRAERPSVRTLRVEVSRNVFLPSPLESFVPVVSKGFKNDRQIRICQLSKCLVDFRGRPFNFWGGYFRFRKKRSCRLISWGKAWKNNI